MRTINSVDAFRIEQIGKAIVQANENNDPIAIASLFRELNERVSMKATSLKNRAYLKNKAEKLGIVVTETTLLLGFKEIALSEGTDYGYIIQISEDGEVAKHTSGLKGLKSEKLLSVSCQERKLLEFYPWNYDDYDEILSRIREYTSNNPEYYEF